MQITLTISDSFSHLPTQRQEELRKWTETRLELELELAEKESTGEYDEATTRIIRNAMQGVSTDIARGVSKEESFVELQSLLENFHQQVHTHSNQDPS